MRTSKSSKWQLHIIISSRVQDGKKVIKLLKKLAYLWNPEVRRSAYKSPPLDLAVSQLNPVHILTFHFKTYPLSSIPSYAMQYLFATFFMLVPLRALCLKLKDGGDIIRNVYWLSIYYTALYNNITALWIPTPTKLNIIRLLTTSLKRTHVSDFTIKFMDAFFSEFLPKSFQQNCQLFQADTRTILRAFHHEQQHWLDGSGSRIRLHFRTYNMQKLWMICLKPLLRNS